MNQDEALIALCKALLQDPDVVEQPGWQKLILIGEVGPGVVGMRGYSYNVQSQCQLIAPSIDLAPLQQLHTAMQAQGADTGVYIAAQGTVTEQAQTFARDHRLTLLPASALAQLLGSARANT